MCDKRMRWPAGDDGLCKVETDDPKLCFKLKLPGEVVFLKKKNLWAVMCLWISGGWGRSQCVLDSSQRRGKPQSTQFRWLLRCIMALLPFEIMSNCHHWRNQQCLGDPGFLCWVRSWTRWTWRHHARKQKWVIIYVN